MKTVLAFIASKVFRIIHMQKLWIWWHLMTYNIPLKIICRVYKKLRWSYRDASFPNQLGYQLHVRNLSTALLLYWNVRSRIGGFHIELSGSEVSQQYYLTRLELSPALPHVVHELLTSSTFFLLTRTFLYTTDKVNHTLRLGLLWGKAWQTGNDYYLCTIYNSTIFKAKLW